MLLVTGCSLARIDAPAKASYGRITMVRLEQGRNSVSVFAIQTPHRIVTQHLKRAAWDTLHSLDFQPGVYRIEVECRRPDAGVVVDGGIDFVATIEAGKTYVLDCAPARDAQGMLIDNHFSLTPVAHVGP